MMNTFEKQYLAARKAVVRAEFADLNDRQIEAVMASGANEGMYTMDADLLRLYREGKISKETALVSCNHYDTMLKKLGN